MDRSSPLLDPSVLRQLRAVAGQASRPGEDVLGTLLGLFANDARTRLQQLRGAAHDNNNEACARLAHAMKGAAANMGAVRVVELALAIEKGAVPSAAELAALADAVEETVSALEQAFDVQQSV
jgi:HPt (histidine-containing phosphotransfer) domain-containing protein